MAFIRGKIASTLLVASVAVPASAHAVHERRQELRAESELAKLTAAIGPATFGENLDRVTLNGGAVRVRTSTVNGALPDVMTAIERECGSGDYDVALGGEPGMHDGRSRPIRLERVVSQEAAEGGVRASLCIFDLDTQGVGAGGTPREPLHRVRYTLANQLPDGRTAITTLVSESETPLSELFPADGDAPGSDLPDVPRPASSRRALTASVGSGEYTVRIYQSSVSVESAIASYDEAMTTSGYTTTGSLPTARMYRRSGRSYVVSFLANSAGSTVTIAPFDGQQGTAQPR